MRLIHGSQTLGMSVSGAFSQKYYERETSIGRMIRELWDTASLFVSLSYEYNEKTYSPRYHVDRLFFDLDSKKGNLEEVYRDLLKLQSYSDRVGTNTFGFLSNSGIHAHLFVKPFWTESPGDIVALKSKLANRLHLKTADWQAFSLTKMPRIPNSITKNGYAIYIADNEYPQETLQRAKSRRKFPGRKREVAIEDLIADLKNVSPHRPSHEIIKPDNQFTEEKPTTAIFEKPCIRVHLSRREAPAYIRWLATIHLKKKGFTVQECVDFFSVLGFDDWNPNRTRYFVEKAFEYKWAATCQKIGENGLCIGESCPFWRNRTGVHQEM